MTCVSTALLGAGLMLLTACGDTGTKPEAANDAAAVEAEGVLEPANAADAAEITPAEANAMDAAIEEALEGDNAANSQ